MTPQEFKDHWANSNEPLSPLTPSRLHRFNLLASTLEFLTTAGLPAYSEPNLSFAIDSDDNVYGVSKLTEQFDFRENPATFEKYIVIGSCRDGDAIAIDTLDNDKIVELDHENLFSAKYFNSSINTLANFLILYRDFEQEVLADKDLADHFQIFNFTDAQFDLLQQKMLHIDKPALTEDGFWKDELDIMLALRLEYYGL